MNLKIEFIIFGALFAFIWGFFLLPKVFIPLVDSNPLIIPPLAFLIYNTGIFIAILLFVYSIMKEEKFLGLRLSVAFWLLYSFLDYWIPPYLVTPNETVLNVAGSKASIDVVFAYIWKSVLPGLSSYQVYLMTYVFSPFLLIFSAAMLLKRREIIKQLEDIF